MPSGPFSGLLVVDLTRVLAGPFCTMLLGELGARVIKVENPDGGDDTRQYVPTWEGRSAYFLSLNRGKESIALNLKEPRDREMLLALVRAADVLVENFRPGTLEKLGLGFEELQRENPRLVFASVSGFGQTGPMRTLPAYDLIVQALGGLMSLTGPPGGAPSKAGISMADITGGLFTTLGIATALYHREKSGKGTRIDVAMLDSLLAIEESAVTRFLATGQVPGPIGNRHPSITPFDSFATADRDLIIACGNDVMFTRLCEALGQPQWVQDPRFATNRDRTANALALKSDVEAILRTRPAQIWVEVFEAAGVPCAVVNSVADAVAMPQVQARQMIVDAEGLRMVGNPIKMSGFPDSPTRTAAPDLDAHGEAIRKEFPLDGKP